MKEFAWYMVKELIIIVAVMILAWRLAELIEPVLLDFLNG